MAVDLPGIQDTAQAKQILGGTATLEFRLVDEEHDAREFVGRLPPSGTRMYSMAEGGVVLLKNQVLLSGESITSANASYDDYCRPMVSISVTGSQVGYFSHATARNIGKSMGIVYIETKSRSRVVNGVSLTTRSKIERVLSAPRIESALGADFRITGLQDPQEAQNLAIMLRSGALLAPIDIAESAP